VDEQGIKKRNRIVLLILCLLFVGLFSLTLLGLIYGFEATPPVKKIVEIITTVVASVVGIFLISAGIYEIVIWFVRKRIRKNDT